MGRSLQVTFPGAKMRHCGHIGKGTPAVKATFRTRTQTVYRSRADRDHQPGIRRANRK